MEPSSGLGFPVLTYLHDFVHSLQSYTWNGKNEQLPCWRKHSQEPPAHVLPPCPHSKIQTVSLNRQSARGCLAPLRDCGEEAVCTLEVAECKCFPRVKWLLPNPSIWQWCPKCSEAVMLLSPKALKSWAFQWGKGELARASLEDKWQPIPRACSEQLLSVKECYDYILPH